MMHLFQKLTIEKYDKGTARLQTWNVIALIPCTHLSPRATGNSDRCIQSYDIFVIYHYWDVGNKWVKKESCSSKEDLATKK